MAGSPARVRACREGAAAGADSVPRSAAFTDRRSANSRSADSRSDAEPGRPGASGAAAGGRDAGTDSRARDSSRLLTSMPPGRELAGGEIAAARPAAPLVGLLLGELDGVDLRAGADLAPTAGMMELEGAASGCVAAVIAERSPGFSRRVSVPAPVARRLRPPRRPRRRRFLAASSPAAGAGEDAFAGSGDASSATSSASALSLCVSSGESDSGWPSSAFNTGAFGWDAFASDAFFSEASAGGVSPSSAAALDSLVFTLPRVSEGFDSGVNSVS